MYSEWVSFVTIVFAILHTVFRIIRPCKAGDGTMSRTLTGMYMAAVFIFAVVVVDTVQDRPTIQPQIVTQPSVAPQPATVNRQLVAARLPSISAARPTQYGERSRVVLKEKYFILGLVFVCFSLLYLVSHRNEQITRMLVWIVMAARRLNPFEHDSRMDGAVVDILLGDAADQKTRQFALDYVLAKRGVSAAVAKIEDESIELPVAPNNARRFSDD